jgi:hypothetical protein
MPADRLLERLVQLEVAAGKRPRAEEGLSRALPEQHLKPAVPDLEHDGEGDVGGVGRLRHKF